MLEKYKQNLNKKQKYVNQKVSRNKKITVQNLEKPGEILPSVQEGTSVGVSVGGSVELSVEHSVGPSAGPKPSSGNPSAKRPKVSCPVCSETFENPSNLKRHHNRKEESNVTEPYDVTEVLNEILNEIEESNDIKM